MNTNKALCGSVLALSALFISGCAQHSRLPADAVKIETRDSGSFVLDEPAVHQEADKIVVHGTVRHANWSTLRSNGHVHVQLLDASRQVVKEARARFSPQLGRRTARTPGPRTANFTATMPGMLPEGAILVVTIAFDEHPTEKKQD